MHEPFDLRHAVHALRRFWYVVLAGLVAGVLGGIAWHDGGGTTFESTAVAQVGPVADELDVIRSSALLVDSYAALLELDVVRGQAAAELGVEELPGSFTVAADDVGRMITVRASATDPELAQGLASALVAQLTDAGAVGPPEGEVNVVQVATTPEEVAGTGLGLLVALGASAGLAFGVAGALVLDRVIARRGGFEPRGPVLRGPRRTGRRRQDSADAAVDEAIIAGYGQLLYGADLLARRDRAESVVVSSGSGEAAGAVGAGIALACAAAGRSVLLVNATTHAQLPDLCRATASVEREGVERMCLGVETSTAWVLELSAWALHDVEAIVEKLRTDFDAVVIAVEADDAPPGLGAVVRGADVELLVPYGRRAQLRRLAGHAGLAAEGRPPLATVAVGRQSEARLS